MLLLLAAIAALLVFFLSRSRPSSQAEQDQRSIAALLACEDELGKRLSLPVNMAITDYTPDMVEHRGGDRYRVESFADQMRGEDPVRRIHYTCSAVRIDEENWRINELEVRE